MRMIGQLDSDKNALIFSDYLFVQGIDNQVERERDGLYTLWVHDEDKIPAALEWLAKFQANPAAPEFKKAAGEARKIAEAQQAEEEAAKKRVIDGRLALHQSEVGQPPYLTVFLMVVCIAVFAVSEAGTNQAVLNALFISGEHTRELSEIRAGEVWRLITPAFVHLSWLHIIFNMLWLKDLGAMIENRLGTKTLAIFVLVSAIGSNLAQNFVSGPNFGGMSGVVYGLLGYCWMRGKHDPDSQLALHPDVVAMMLIWFVVCFTRLVGPIANTAHAAGLIIGVVWGYLSARVAVARR